MKNGFMQLAEKQNISRKKRKGWRSIVRVLGAAVVFCTTYALILPAITMQQETVCGLEEHTHVEECYAVQDVYTYDCGIGADVIVLHTHNERCLDEGGNLVCPLPEIEHVHGEDCYQQTEKLICENTHLHSESCTTETVLVCGKEETQGHTHGEGCVPGTRQKLICQEAESAGHTHGDACFDGEGTLVCQEAETAGHTHGEACYETEQIDCVLEEAEGHTHDETCSEVREITCPLPDGSEHVHTEECYELTRELTCTRQEFTLHAHGDSCKDAEGNLTCTLEEHVLHTHSEQCYDAEGNLTCQLPQIMVHAHEDSCLTVLREQQVLTCQLSEHTHEDSCYPEEAEDDDVITYICGLGVHTHGEACLDEAGEVICNIPEHAHEAACVVEDLDLTADVETPPVWEQTLQQLYLTGSWPADVAAVAQSQLGYRESARNVILDGEELRGYNRYGAWYGEPYSEWSAEFAAFCLHYARVEGFPLNADAALWMEQLKTEGLYASADAYTAKRGDLVFFDHDRKKDAQEEIEIAVDRVGIVLEQIPATESEPGKIKVIEGDAGNEVACVTYDLDDPAVIGYGVVPVGNLLILEYQGADFTVSVRLDAGSGIPETAQLSVREILPGTEEYEMYYQQSVQALIAQRNAEDTTEADLNVSFARFFDITFLVDGVAVEPATPAQVQIRYTDSFAVEDGNAGVVVHFAEEGTEILNADTNEEGNEADTFDFTQGSFSVSGTLVAAELAVTGTRVEPYQIDNTAQTMYILYTQISGRYYALDGNGYPVAISVNGNNVSYTGDNIENLLWSFTEAEGAYAYNPISNLGTKRYLHPFNNGGSNQGVTTSNPYGTTLNVSGSTFKIRGNGNNYAYFPDTTGVARPTTNTGQANNFYAAEVGRYYNVWFDGTDGGMMSYYGAANENRPVVASGGTAVVELPETWQSSTKYDYVLKGWYDIKNHKYYPVNPNDEVQPTAEITGHTVFYADWVAATYDVGHQNANTVNSLDTSDFITTYVFDYNALFNVQSQTHTGTVSAGGHSETWTVVNNGKVPYNDADTLGFVFVDYDAGGEFSYANGRDNTNVNQGDAITPGIIEEVRQASGGKNLMDILFNPSVPVIGKHYVGTGNYLFQYMDSTTANYDGIHDGYYYLDARLNAASYNQSQQRFYLYNYLERTSDSRKDGGVGQYSDFLPFNSPYLFEPDQLNEYTDPVRRPGYEYDAKDGGTNHPEYNDLDDANTNYFFGIRSDIEFFLPNDAGTMDEYQNYGNISTRGEHMIFDFHGDDDVWVFIDGELVLDIGGLHGVMFGQIDFSTGTVTSGKDGGATTTRTFQQILGHNIKEGTHTMTVYYMERGSSQSNCAIYFNIAPRYSMDLIKEDINNPERLAGAEFTIYTCEHCANGNCTIHGSTQLAQLWDSRAAYEADMADGVPDNYKSTFVANASGECKIWGVSAGKSYYIKETKEPAGYPETDDLIRVTLNNRGTATIETTTLHGANGKPTEGFGVISWLVDDSAQLVRFLLSNQKNMDTTEVRIKKTWEGSQANIPQSITVYLTRDGVRYGRTAVLHEGNGWSYTWQGLPKYREDGVDQEYVYGVEEILVPNFITIQGESQTVVNHVDWVRVDQMSDSNTFLLVHNGQALTCSGSFGWTDIESAKSDPAAQWNVTTDHDGFHLKNGLRYTLTYSRSGNNFYGVDNDAAALNQVVYYLNARLVVHDNDAYYQFGSGGSAVGSDGLAFQLYRKDIITGLMANITNRPVEEETQTFVEVNKVWSDGADKHADHSVVIHLLSDGRDTGRTVTLNAANNWTASFENLPYYGADGVTKIVYTVKEETLNNYIPEYSDPETLPGKTVSMWQGVSELSEGKFRISSGGYSLSVSGYDVVSVANNLSLQTQQWNVIPKAGYFLLRNVSTNKYLGLDGDSLTTVDAEGSAARVTLEGNKIRVGTKYMELGRGYTALTGNAANATAFLVSKWISSETMPGTGFTVTNLTAGYELPNTGGLGLPFFLTFGMLLIAAAALMYHNQLGRKREKGGKYCR